MEFSYLTDPGQVRDHNEDSVTIVKNNLGEILMAVADGMGGHKGGEIASSIAITHIGKRFIDTSSVGNKEDAINFLKEIVSEANMLLYRYTEDNPESVGLERSWKVTVSWNSWCGRVLEGDRGVEWIGLARSWKAIELYTGFGWKGPGRL